MQQPALTVELDQAADYRLLGFHRGCGGLANNLGRLAITRDAQIHPRGQQVRILIGEQGRVVPDDLCDVFVDCALIVLLRRGQVLACYCGQGIAGLYPVFNSV